MTQRGSFVTEYIDCDKCCAAAERVLTQDQQKYFFATRLPSWTSPEEKLPIIAGKIGAMYHGGEHAYFDENYVEDLENALCHPLKVVIIPESHDPVTIVITPKPRG